MVTESKHKRSKSKMIILWPVLMFIFLMGICMYYIGDQKRTPKTKNKRAIKDNKKDNVTLKPIVFEEKQEIIHE